MKKIFLPLLMAVLLLFSSCSAYTGSYKAVGFVHSEHGKEARISFRQLDGRYVVKLKSDNQAEGAIHYKASLESGELSVSYDYMGIKEPLCNIKAGEPVDTDGGYIEGGKVTIIVETVTPCKGEIEFSIR